MARVKLVKPEKAEQLEDQLVRMAKGGQLKGTQMQTVCIYSRNYPIGQVSEAQLTQLLEQVSGKEATKKVIVSL